MPSILNAFTAQTVSIYRLCRRWLVVSPVPPVRRQKQPHAPPERRCLAVNVSLPVSPADVWFLLHKTEAATITSGKLCFDKHSCRSCCCLHLMSACLHECALSLLLDGSCSWTHWRAKRVSKGGVWLCSQWDGSTHGWVGRKGTSSLHLRSDSGHWWPGMHTSGLHLSWERSMACA